MTSEFDPQADRDLPNNSDLSQTQTAADDHDVAEALSDLSRLVSDLTAIDDVLAQIAEFALVAVPGADGTGVTLLHPKNQTVDVMAWAVTAEFVRDIDRLQYDVCGEGPCLTAMQTGRPLTSGSLGSDGRWPRFGGRVARLAVHSALALPLLVHDEVVGAINVYAHDRDSFGEHAVTLGEQFAGPAAVSVHNTRMLHAARDRAEHLQVALRSRAVIDQAIGIIRSRSGRSEQEAFNSLRSASQSDQVKLSVVAQRLVDQAVSRAHTRHEPT